MKVIPVLDVRRGRAVHAVAGARAHYGPLRGVLRGGTDPVALARSARDAWGLPDLYLADLDAILGEAAPAFETFRAIADLGITLWADAGVRLATEARPLVDAGVGRVVVGLETIAGPGALAGVVAEVGPDAVAFSVDLREGRPLVDTRLAWGTDDPAEIAARAVEAGARTLIHLDLARVGTARGVATPPPPPTPGVEWILGGGVADFAEVVALRRAGFHGVLVGSALHGGRITADQLRELGGSTPPG